MYKSHGECCDNCLYSREIPDVEFPEYFQKYSKIPWAENNLFCFAGEKPLKVYRNLYTCVNPKGRWKEFHSHESWHEFYGVNQKDNEWQNSNESKPKIMIVFGDYDIHLHKLLLVVKIQDLTMVKVLADYNPIAELEAWDLSKKIDFYTKTIDGLYEAERRANMTEEEIHIERDNHNREFLGSWYGR